MADDPKKIAAKLYAAMDRQEPPSWSDIYEGVRLLNAGDAALQGAIRERDEARAEIEVAVKIISANAAFAGGKICAARREALEQAARIALDEKSKAERKRRADLPPDVRACWLWSEQTAEHIERAIRALIAAQEK